MGWIGKCGARCKMGFRERRAARRSKTARRVRRPRAAKRHRPFFPPVLRTGKNKIWGRRGCVKQNIWQGEKRKLGGGGAQHDSAEGSFEG
jgi:hypothetical protein